MTMHEEKSGPTPNGGVKSIAYFLDADRKPTDKTKAVFIEIYEYDEHGTEVFRTHLVTERSTGAGEGD
jgi:hypothetical protein